MAVHFEMDACQKDASLLAFVRSLHHETTRVASDFLIAESAAADKTKQLTVLTEALRNQNEALVEQTALLSKLVHGERESKEQQLLMPDSPRPVRGHRRVFSQDAVDELRQQQEARRALLEDWEVDEKVRKKTIPVLRSSQNCNVCSLVNFAGVYQLRGVARRQLPLLPSLLGGHHRRGGRAVLGLRP